MPQNTTDCESLDLSPKQSLALAELLSGATVTRAAEAAKVDRGTVHRWVRNDHRFGAALNQGRREIRNAAQAQLLVGAEQAAEVVRRSIENGDVRTALAVLRGLGLLGGKMMQIGTDDPEILRQEAQLAAKKATSDRRLRELIAL